MCSFQQVHSLACMHARASSQMTCYCIEHVSNGVLCLTFQGTKLRASRGPTIVTSHIQTHLLCVPADLLKYFGYELGAQTNFDKNTGTCIVNGAHDSKKVSVRAHRIHLAFTCPGAKWAPLVHHIGSVGRPT